MRPALSLLLVFCLAHCAPEGAGPATAVSPITVETLDSLLSAGKGKVRLVNIWATWCQPCMDEIPALVKIRDEYAGSGVEIVLISADDPDDADSLVVPMMEKLGVNFPGFIITEADPDDFIRFMHPDWTGAMPASFLYDRNGKQAGWFIGERTYGAFEPGIRELLNE